jgi:hypothetical protein
MIVNTHLKNKRGQDLYKNVLTGDINPLSQQEFQPSERKSKRLQSGQRKAVSSTKIAKTTQPISKTGFAYRVGRFVKKLTKQSIKTLTVQDLFSTCVLLFFLFEPIPVKFRDK